MIREAGNQPTPLVIRNYIMKSHGLLAKSTEFNKVVGKNLTFSLCCRQYRRSHQGQKLALYRLEWQTNLTPLPPEDDLGQTCRFAHRPPLGSENPPGLKTSVPLIH